jgi:hypothetical protein
MKTIVSVQELGGSYLRAEAQDESDEAIVRALRSLLADREGHAVRPSEAHPVKSSKRKALASARRGGLATGAHRHPGSIAR